jgi:ABC-type multidrug transport system fused ATPase/permease subunit
VIANEYPPPAISLNDRSIYAIPLLDYRTACVHLFPQDSYLFSGTIREVVDPHLHHSAEVILTQLKKFSQVIFSDSSTSSSQPVSAPALSSSSASHLFSLEYEVTANGGNLSAGEKQILTLVRASLSEAKVVILDEITSNMSIPAAEIALKMLRFLSSAVPSSHSLTELISWSEERLGFSSSAIVPRIWPSAMR